jgi:hypothetical protein
MNNDEKFNNALNDIVIYYQEEKGITNIPLLKEDEVLRLPIDLIGETSGIFLNPFIRKMRKDVRTGVLSEYREEKLNSIIGENWEVTHYSQSNIEYDENVVYNIPSYKFGFKLARKFKNQYHRLPNLDETWTGEISGKKYNVGEFVYRVKELYKYPNMDQEKYAKFQRDLKYLFD